MMRPIKTAEEFQALLDKALLEHEKRGLSKVSLRVVKDASPS